jgi:hypothetical protein
MSTILQSDQYKEMVRNQCGLLNNVIGSNVIRSLGSPSDLLKVQVRPISNSHYRVNVLVGKNAASVRIADSFFVTADFEGTIVTSSPEIVRLY